MPQGKPRSGERYLHFKNKLYQIVTIAKHSETGEELVIYQALYDDFGVYARPLSMFISEVDHVKYPQVRQKYRFTLVENLQEKKLEEPEAASAEETKPEEPEVASVEETKPEEPGTVSAEDRRLENKDITELLMDFYDARDYEERYKILTAMRDEITDVMINNMAVVLDVVIPEGDLDKRYEELVRCLRTYQKYEAFR